MFNIMAGIAWLISGGFLSFIFIRKLAWMVRLRCTGGRTDATVMEVVKQKEYRINTADYPRLSYNANENTHTVDYKHRTMMDYYKKGQVLKIAYDKTNADNILVITGKATLVGYTVMSLFWLYMLGSGIWTLVTAVFL